MSSSAYTDFDDRARRVALAVQQATGVEQVLLFGSRARGDYSDDSDIDLLVVHPTDHGIHHACHEAAWKAIRTLYDDCIRVDIVLVSPSLFATMRFGVNHVAAQASRDGVTPMGCAYRLLTGASPLQDPHRLEAMERAYHARAYFTTLKNIWKLGDGRYTDPSQFDLVFGQAAQGCLEHALKSVIAATGHPYGNVHDLAKLAAHASQAAPRFPGLQSPLRALSAFAEDKIYNSPDLEPDVDRLFDQVERDMTHLFAWIRQRADFDPWTVRKSAFKF